MKSKSPCTADSANLSFRQKLYELASFEFGVIHYLQKQTDADVFSGVDWDHGDSAVMVLHDDVAAVFSGNLEAYG